MIPNDVSDPAKSITKVGNPMSTILIPILLKAVAIKTTRRRTLVFDPIKMVLMLLSLS